MSKDPLQLVDLTTCRTDFEAEVLAHALESEGIPAKAFSAAASILQWEVATSQPIRVQVRRCDLEKARLALARVRQESVDFDWSELEAEGFDEVCKRCGHSLKDLEDKTLCPECGYRHEFGGSVGTVAVKARRSRKVWVVVAVVLLVLMVTPFVVAAVRLALGMP
jgi:hypothetical protein